MPCLTSPLHPDRLTLQGSQRERFTRLYGTLREGITDIIPEEQLESLGLARGSSLDVDNLGKPCPRDVSCHFFSPCDWSQDSLDWESHSGYTDSEWKNLTPFVDDVLFEPLDVARFRSSWFQVRLLGLESIEENVWEPVIREADGTRWHRTREAIQETIGLELPRREYYWDTPCHGEHEYKGTWAYFAAAAADRPHAVCSMIDSSINPPGDTVIRSEALAAVKMTEFQLQRACFAHHDVKPILICTYFRNETARITQAHFNAVRDRLVLRQSRLLDLSGPETPPDAWLMLRWMASSPVGVTQYQPTAALPDLASEDGTSRPPQITIAN